MTGEIVDATPEMWRTHADTMPDEAAALSVLALADLHDAAEQAGVVAHRQTSPESRDWLAKLMGTRAVWQNTSQTSAHGRAHTGQGSARRVREPGANDGVAGIIVYLDALDDGDPVQGAPERKLDLIFY